MEKLDLFKLDNGEKISFSLRIVFNSILRDKFITIVLSLCKEEGFENISKEFGISYSTLWDYLHRSNTIPLIIFSKLEIRGFFLRDYISHFSCLGGNSVKLPQFFDDNLARLTGAIIADGNLMIRKSSRGRHYRLVIRDEGRYNFYSLIKYFKNSFDLKPIFYWKSGCYNLEINNKIIVLFFIRVINLPSGKKSDIIEVPDLVFKSSDNIKLSFLQGIFMFDGGIDFATGYIGLTSKSLKLIDGIVKILIDLSLFPDYVSERSDKLGRYKIIFRKKENLEKCLCLFEEKTEKWNRLYYHLYVNLNNFNGNYKEFLNKLKVIYPKRNDNYLHFFDVFQVIEDFGGLLTCDDLSKKLKKRKTTIHSNVLKLESFGLLKSEKKGLRKYWGLNFDLIRRKK